MMNDERTTTIVLELCRAYVSNEGLTEETTEILSKDDTSELIAYLVKHKLVAIAHNVIFPYKEQLHNHFYKQLAQRVKNIALRNMAMYKEQKVIEQAFAQKGIFMHSYKGVVFSQLFYGSLSLRSSVDIDFSIRLSDLGHSYDILSELGYEEVKGGLNDKNVKKSRAYYLDYPWSKMDESGFNMLAELHLSPAHKALYVPVEFEDYFPVHPGHSENRKTDFSIVDHALFILIHHGAVDLWGKLMHLIDLHQILTVLDHAQTTELIELCEKARIRKFLDLGILLCERILRTSYNVAQKHEISVSLVDRIYQECLNSQLAGKWSENRNKLKYHLLLRDSRKDQIMALRSLARYGIFDRFGI